MNGTVGVVSGKQSPNRALIRFAKKARDMGMTYGQLQTKETWELIKAGKLEPQKKKSREKDRL